MDPPETRYAKSGDLDIAYQVTGSGPLDLVFVPGFVSNLDLVWENPGWAHFFTRLTAFSRLIMFDKRGTGLSDRLAGIATLEERMDDVRAVMDAVGSNRAALFGVSEGGPMSLLFAATYPDRAAALVLYGSFARHPALSMENRLNERLALINRTWGTGEYARQMFTPSIANDDAVWRAFGRFERQSASPAAAMAILKMNGEIDTQDILPSIHLPTLVLHRSGDISVAVEAARDLARNIPGAKYVELPGENYIPVFERDILDRIINEGRGVPHGLSRRRRARSGASHSDVHRHRRLDQARGGLGRPHVARHARPAR